VSTVTHLAAAALTAAERGWHVFPLRPGDKRPAFPDHSQDRCHGRDPRCARAGHHIGWEQRATRDPDRIRRAWSTTAYNIGIATGPSGLVVIDLDLAKPDPNNTDPAAAMNGADTLARLCDQAGQPALPDTYTVRTGRGGTHLYYQHPNTDAQLRNTTGTLGPHIDTRAHGGYVVAAASTVPTGTYTLTVDLDPAPLPDWLTTRLHPTPHPAGQPVTVTIGPGRRGAYLNAAITRALTVIANAPDGRLNATVWGAAAGLGQLAAGDCLNPDEITTLLLDAAVAKGHPAAGAARTIASGLRTGARTPRDLHDLPDQPGRADPRCGHWAGDHYCHTTDRVRRYLNGYRCPHHTPAAINNRPEPPNPATTTPLPRQDAA
jgi:hypothetical protein